MRQAESLRIQAEVLGLLRFEDLRLGDFRRGLIRFDERTLPPIIVYKEQIFFFVESSIFIFANFI